MCLIINKPAGMLIPDYHIRNAWENNSDGFGAMWAENGQIRVIQGLFDIDRIAKLMRSLQHKDAAIHFRYSTVGKVNEQNVHPFQVLNKAEDGMDLWLMHNGTFSFIKSNDGHSDTWHFAQKLRPIVRKVGLDAFRDPRKRAAMGEKIGKYNKVLLMSGDGEVIVVNEDSGYTVGPIWYSNQYSLESNYRRGKGISQGAIIGDNTEDYDKNDYEGRAQLYRHLWGEKNGNVPRRPSTHNMHYTPTQVRTAAGSKSTPVRK